MDFLLYEHSLCPDQIIQDNSCASLKRRLLTVKKCLIEAGVALNNYGSADRYKLCLSRFYQNTIFCL